MNTESFNLSDVLFNELGYIEKPGFRSYITKNENPFELPNVNFVYSIQNNIPIAYFSILDEANPSQILQLHKLVWNESKVPLLYIILPNEIRIYNTYAKPVEEFEQLNNNERLLNHLTGLNTLLKATQKIKEELYNTYNYINLETGAFWNTVKAQKIKRESRADSSLLKSMVEVCKLLIEPNFSSDLAYTLLGRSIFIRYLEDRGILTDGLISQWTNGKAQTFIQALENLNTTYELFGELTKHFNGDLFLSKDKNELDFVTENKISLIKLFLEGYDFKRKMSSFWPYDFRYIPKELISCIYDNFLYSEDEEDSNQTRRKLGAFYTPLPLVDYLIDETLPFGLENTDLKILDPACGSGVFLVRAYQRLVEYWKNNNGYYPSPIILSEILTNSIYGVDIEEKAIQVTIFSLYLALLDYVKNEDILDGNFHFPNLKGTNLITSDFFELDETFKENRFDRIIGNLPWGRGTLKEEGLRKAREEGHEIGGKQIVQRFLLTAPNLCSTNGELALIAPARSTILLTSETNIRFRNQLFNNFSIRAVINFSALVYELFPNAISPAVAIFYNSSIPQQGEQIIYGVPKPSPISNKLGAIIVDSKEIKYLKKEELLTNPSLWKVAAWGTPRDELLIKRLQKLPKLKTQLELLGWDKLREGFRVEFKGSDKYRAEWLQNMPFVPANNFHPYVAKDYGTVKEYYGRGLYGNVDEVIKKQLQGNENNIVFDRPREEEIYKGPLVLIQQSECLASYSDTDIAFTSSLSVINGKAGQEDLLKWLVAVINSPLTKYYHFLTSSRWAVERGNILQIEYENMPFLLPIIEDSQFKEIIYHFDQISNYYYTRNELYKSEFMAEIEYHTSKINDLVLDIYGINYIERQLIKDIITFEIGFFEWFKQNNRKIGGNVSVSPPPFELLIDYAQAFTETANVLLRYQGQALKPIVYRDGAPLTVVEFDLVPISEVRALEVISSSNEVRRKLVELNKLLVDQKGPTLFVRRHVRIYDGPRLYLIRPSECRFWTVSQARSDADSFITEAISINRQPDKVSV